MNIQKDSKKWEMVLGVAEIAAVAAYAWQHARKVTHAAESGGVSPPARPREIAHDVPAAPPEGAEQVLQGRAAALADGPKQALTALVKGQGFGLKELGQIAIDAAKAWSAHRAASKGAALALYTLFSLAPMLVLVVAVAGLFFGVDAVRELVGKQLGGLLGGQGADAVKSILAGAHYQSDSLWAAVISIALVLVGATSAFSELKDSLDELWDVPEKTGSGIWALVRSRFLSFGLVLVLALMLLISLAVSTALAALGDIWVGGVGNEIFVVFAKIVSSVVSFLIVTALFGTIYKYLPAAKIAWRDVILGSFITAVLFITGKFLIGLYLSTTNFSSGYGAAGSLVLMVSWIYYSAQIFFYGALFTHQHAVRSGRAKPSPGVRPGTKK
ncbi:MAG: hypothetical protein NVSMB6_29960 [Burkholderiaceae bacterium]